MLSIKELYKIGNGPSSSHTMGPRRATKLFKENYPEADRFDVILYGSLAATGKGHLTDEIIRKEVFPIEINIIFDTKTECKVHPNTMDLIAYKEEKELGKWTVYSIGGGDIQIKGQERIVKEDIYDLKKFKDIREYCISHNMHLYDYVYEKEGKEEIQAFLKEIWYTMKKCVQEGIRTEGTLPGRLKINRRAKELFYLAKGEETPEFTQSRLLSAYAYAVSETNAAGGIIVTAPTCGSAGVLPAVLFYLEEKNGYSDEEIINALATAALIGNVVKTNASISGAECGCQAEIGTACSMAAAAVGELYHLTVEQIEDAAEVAMEHHLGLTCDPIYGYVQIPCIERNAIAAMRAIDACNMSILLPDKNRISFDMVVDTMYETGKDLSSHYKETSEGGLAKKYCRNKYYNTSLERKLK